MSTPIPMLDLMFFLTETQDNPRHVGSVLIFRKPARGAGNTVREIVEAYRRAKPRPPFNRVPVFRKIGLPEWRDVDTIDPAHHVLHVALPAPGSNEQLHELIADLHAPMFERHRPAFAAMGGEIIHMGPLGSAMLIKVITNMLAFIHLVADGEALMLAKKGGIDLKLAWDVIKASSGNSFVHETEGQLILSGSYNINFTMDLARKDLFFAHQMGREFGVPLELGGLTEQIFARARAMYGGGAQSPMVVKMLEEAVDTELRAPGFPTELEPE